MLILFGLFVRQNGGFSIMIGQKACQLNSQWRVKSLPTFLLIPEAISFGYTPQYGRKNYRNFRFMLTLMIFEESCDTEDIMPAKN